jgi:hypothetical protein
MIGLFLCILSLIASYLLGRRSLGRGLGAVIAVGYFYGIVRAQYLDGFTHFFFDLAVLGLYAAQLVMARTNAARRLASREILPWVVGLIGWPLILFLVPVQHILIQFVGLRAAIYFVPFLLLGARATERDLEQVARIIAGLNLIAFGFAIAEFILGIERFYPLNAVTDIIYRSSDVAGGGFRIPATFSSAHAYGGTMVATLPFIINRWQASSVSPGERVFVASAIIASSVGIFMAGPRLPVVVLFLELAVVAISRRLPLRLVVGLGILGSLVGYFVAGSERLQRFRTLADTGFVGERVSWSLNLNLVDSLAAHPMGTGLGSAGGTSIPYFLQHLAGPQIGLENEYARIAMELSPLGLLIWLAFIVWTIRRRSRPVSRDWVLGMKVMRAFVLVSWATAFIGTGMLTAIPGTTLLLLQMGILGRSRLPQEVPAAPRAGMAWQTRSPQGSL